MRLTSCFLCFGLTVACCTHGSGSVNDLQKEGRKSSTSTFRLVDLCPKSHEVTIVALVEDGCRQPVEGASVVAVDRENPGCFYHGSTDPSGAFALSHLPAEAAYDLYVEVVQDGCVAATSTAVVPSERAIVLAPFTLPPPCCVKLRD